jgi:cell division protein FtsL
MQSFKLSSPEKDDTPVKPRGTLAKIGHGFKVFFTSLLVIFVCFIFITIFKQILAEESRPESTSQPTQAEEKVETYTDTEVYVESQFILEKFLKAPSTAKFPSSSNASIERLKDNGFKVTSYVDSQNGFGAMIRSEWTVLFQYVGDQIKLYQVIIDGEEMYRGDVTE